MDTILLLTHSEADGSLPKAALEALSAAKSLGAPVTAAVFGGSVDAAAKALSAAAIRPASHLSTSRSLSGAEARMRVLLELHGIEQG